MPTSDPDRIPATPHALQQILKLRPVLWVGAGTSIAAGLPSTARLVEAIRERAEGDIDPGLSFPQVADAFVAEMGEGELDDILQRELAQPVQPTALHQTLARLAGAGAFAAIVTTNYDDLLERALGDAGVRYVLQPLDANDVVVDLEAEVRLLKLHGTRGDWLRAVLSGEAYDLFGQRYPRLVSQLDGLLRRHPVLLVGCSLQDPRLVDWLAGLDDGDARRLKRWRPLMTLQEWQAADCPSGAAARITLRLLRGGLGTFPDDELRKIFVRQSHCQQGSDEEIE